MQIKTCNNKVPYVEVPDNLWNKVQNDYVKIKNDLTDMNPDEIYNFCKNSKEYIINDDGDSDGFFIQLGSICMLDIWRTRTPIIGNSCSIIDENNEIFNEEYFLLNN